MQTLVKDDRSYGRKRDPMRKRLQALQKPLTRHLWVPSDAITFTPQVSGTIYGDGRALFGIGTINSRPAYWIIRGCSSWSSAFDTRGPDEDVDIGQHIDTITFDLEDEFGRAECGETFDWVENSHRIRDRETGRFMSYSEISYPVFNYGGGAHWFRLDWPKLPGVKLVRHPYDGRTQIVSG